MKKHFIKFISLSVAIIFCFNINAQKGLEISLRADYEQEKKALHNEPLIFIVTLTNKSAQSDKLWNISADRRIRQIDELVKQDKLKKEDADKEKQELEKNKRSSPAITIGSATSSWTSQLKWIAKNTQTGQTVILPLQLMSNPACDAVAVLAGGTNILAYYGISPGEMMAVPVGNYEVSVMLNDIVSDRIMLYVQRESINEAIADEAMLLKYGQFYWHAGDSKQTMNYAEKILKKNPLSVDGYSLKGDAQVMENSYLPALESYNAARENYYKQFGSGAEPPEYLLNMIGMVKEKLGEVK
jgi:tetratricopeptide (TPR) repeat protein